MTANAIVPARATIGSVGYDLCAIENTIIPPKQTKIIKTGLSVEIPEGYEMQIRPRSGISVKSDVVVMLGTIDSDYRGEIGIICKNIGDVQYVICAGDKLAQFVFKKVEIMDIEVVDNLTETKRGNGGFGSTGLSQADDLKRLVQEVNNNAIG